MQNESQRESEVIPGFTTFRNSDGIFCILLNYRAQSELSIDLEAFNITQKKRGMPTAKNLEEYWDIEAQKMGGKNSPKWLKEMENQFGAANKHLAAYYNFNFNFHTAHYPGKIYGAPVHIGIDFGTHTCAVIGQTESSRGFEQLHLHECVRGVQEDLGRFITRVIDKCKFNYPGSQITWYMAQEGVQASPSGIHSSSGARSPLEEFYKHRIIPKWKWHNIKDGVECINQRMLTIGQGGIPTVTVNPADKGLIDMFNGGYRREKNFSHGKSIPTPSYFKDGWHDHCSDAARPIFYCLYVVPYKSKAQKGKTKKKAPRLPI